MKQFYLIILTFFSFTTAAIAQCDYEIVMSDSYGDGWNGASISVSINGIVTSVTCSGASTTATVPTEDNAAVEFSWNSGAWDGECAAAIYAPDGGGLYQFTAGNAPGAGALFYQESSNAPGCDPPPLCAQGGVEANGQNIDIQMTDSYGDGWDGASISVCLDGSNLYTSSFTSGGSDGYNFDISPGQVYNITYASGNYEGEHSYIVLVDGIEVLNTGTSPPVGTSMYGSYCLSGALSGVTSACQLSTSQLAWSGVSGGSWSSSDPTIASVIAESGLVAAVSPGSVNIIYTAPVDGGSCQASSSITFNTLSAPSAGTLSASATSFNVSLTSQVSSDGNTGGTYSSSDVSIATVDPSSGLVSGIGAGSVTITYEVAAAGCETVQSTISLTVEACPAGPSVCAMSTGTTLAEDMAITSVSFSDMTNTSGGGDYTNYFCSVSPATVDQGGSYTFSYSIAGTYNQYVYVAFDWDQDGTFESINLVAQAVSGSISIDVPSDAVTGTTVMRVLASYFDPAGDVCTTQTYGDCEDYAITVNITCQSITLTGDVNACEGGTGLITADLYPGGSWASDDTNVATVDNSGNINAISGGTANITYTGANPCPSSTGSIVWETLSSPDAGSISLSSSVVNLDATVNATSSGNPGGDWTSSDDAVATVDISTGVVTGVTVGSADITYTIAASGCPTATASTPVTVACASDLVVTYGDVQHCGGNSSNLSGSVSNPAESYTYTFNGADSYGDGWTGWAVDIAVDGVTVESGFTLSGGSSGSTTFSAGVGSEITLTWASGTYASEISWTIVDPSGTTLSSGNTQTPLSATTTYSNASYTYAWSPSTDLDDASIASPVASNTATTTYTLTVTNASGCTGTADVIATVENPIAGTLSGTQTLAPGGTTTISSDGTTGGEWTSSDDAVATVDISTGVVTGVAAGTADITYTVGGTACPDAATITVTVACAADLVATYDDVEHCLGNSSTLSGTVSDPGESYTYTFNGVDSFGDGWNGWSVDIAVDGVTVESGFTLATGAAGSTTFSAGAGAAITLTWASGNYASEISWTIVDPTGATLSSGNTQTTDGGTTTYTDASYTYAWSPSTDLDDATSASPVASNSTTETYTVVVTNSIGCTGTTTVTANVNAVTAGNVEASVDNQLTYSTELQTAQVGSPLFWNYVTGSSVVYTFNGADSYGDGWNGGSVDIAVDGSTVVTGFTVEGSSESTTFSADPGAAITLTWVGGSYPSEISWTIDDPSGVTLSSGNTVTTDGGTVPSSGGPTGTFDNFAYQWDATDPNGYSNGWASDASTIPWTWGDGQTFGAGSTLYVVAQVSCGSNQINSDPVAINWITCYGGSEDITATLDNVSIADDDEMTINNDIAWTAPTDAFGDEFHWLYSWDGGSSFSTPWQNNVNPATWSDNVGSFVASGDANLTVRYVATGTNCTANSIMDFDVLIRQPVITVSTISNTLEVCEGADASASETFTVSGQYIANDDNTAAASVSHTGILVTPPSGLEVSLDDVTYSSSINISATDGTIASTTVYVRIIAGQDGADASGDIACTAQAATTQNVSATATIQENAEVETSISFTTGTGTCGEVEISVSVNGVESGSGAWSTGLFGQGNFGSVTDVSTTFTTGTFGSTITLTWTTDDGGACNDQTTSVDAIFEQPETDMIDNSFTMDTESWLWGGLTDDSWTEPTNWYKYTDDGVGNFAWRRQTVNTPNAADKVYIMANQDAGQCVSATNSALTVEGASMTDLMVANNATLNLAGTASVSGNITNDGTIQAAGASMLSIDGSGDQTISGNEITLNDLELNKSGGNLIMTTPINVSGVLNMTSGNIVNTNDILTVGSASGAGTLNHTSGIVTGKMRQYFPNSSGAKFFPIGNSAIQRDVTVDFTSAPGESQYLTASYNAGYPQANDGSDLYTGLPLVTSDDQVIQNYDDEGYWEIIPGSASTGDSYATAINGKAYNVSIRCNDLTGEDNLTHMDRSKVRVIKSAGPGHTSWQGLTHESIVGTDADFTVTASGTGFSFFGAGTEDDNALPVELVSFSGDCEDGLVNLEWQTASENNSDDFELEYSRDGIDWSLIHTEPAAGFSTELITYNFEHEQAISGDNYYRLTQNDVDGSSVVYDNLVINASCQSTANGYFSVFPNPSAGSFQVIMNNPEIEGTADLKIVDTKGSVVFMKSIVVNSGINMYVIQQDLAPGIYYINVENGSKTTTIVKHSVR